MRKHQNSRYQTSVIASGPRQGYFQILDTQDNNKVIQSGFISEQDAYDTAYWMNEAFLPKEGSIKQYGQEWLDLPLTEKS